MISQGGDTSNSLLHKDQSDWLGWAGTTDLETMETCLVEQIMVYVLCVDFVNQIYWVVPDGRQ